ncbi:MAG: hypothetical protein STSR0008_14360 [Ignavibacterium sp.]
MALTQKQKKLILSLKNKKSIPSIAKELKIKEKDIEEFLNQRNLLDKSDKNILNKKTPFIFYIILILIPISFFILLELGLRIFHYGMDNRQWINITENALMINPDIAKRYFYTTKNVPGTIQDIFDVIKKPNSFRVFVVGESSAAGYPFMPLGSFSRYLRDRLKLVYPNSKIEIVNIAITAINSYTIRDLFPGILEQKPDLILIYTGHNEYVGALGVGSNESLGSSRTMINFILYLNRFKTVELIRNVIKSIFSSVSSSQTKNSDATLMARIARDQQIAYNSDKFNAGISQFEGNIRDVLKMTQEKNVPVILSTLVSNLKDQYPFVSIKENGYPKAMDIYKKANEEFHNGNIKIADSLYRFAKDLDALRFRAPEKINYTIHKLGKEFNYPVVNIDSAFCVLSPNKIIGNEIMTDHLHPTLRGQLLMGKLFYEEMEKYNLLPKESPKINSNEKQDSLTISHFNYTYFDSLISTYRIKILKNDWPFVKKKTTTNYYTLLQPKNTIDSIAVAHLNGEIVWEQAERKAASYYLSKKDYDSFTKQMDVLISQYPIIFEYYEIVTNELLKIKQYDKALKYLQEGYNIQPTAFFTKWLGTVYLYKNNLDEAISFLEMSLKFKSNDAQAYYNLAGAYSLKKDYSKALELVNKCLSIESNYPQAINLRNQLLNVIRN